MPALEDLITSNIVGPTSFYAQDTDPGAVGAGLVWKDTSATPKKWWERNAANDGWDAINEVVSEAVGDAEAYARTKAFTTGAGGALAGPIATTEGAGSADVRPTATSGGAMLGAGMTGAALAGSRASSDDGAADASPVATTSGAGSASAAPYAAATDAGDAHVEAIAAAVTGNAKAGSWAVRGAVAAGMYAEVDNTGVAKIGFNAVAASQGIPIPELPATPTEQDIADALVALGLVTQAP